jgi:hypothetical protein
VHLAHNRALVDSHRHQAIGFLFPIAPTCIAVREVRSGVIGTCRSSTVARRCVSYASMVGEPRPEHLPLLKKAGLTLLVVGLFDIGVMIYVIASHGSYSSSLNIIALIAGIFLKRGSLRAAAVVLWFALFLLAASISGVVLLPLLLPFGLLAAHAQVNPLAFISSFAVFAVLLSLSAWLVTVLRSPQVQRARASAGRPARKPHVPVALGIGLAILLFATNFTAQDSASAARAKSEARAEHGDEYQYHVSSIQHRGRLVSGVVTAWNSGSIKELPFQWSE